MDSGYEKVLPSIGKKIGRLSRAAQVYYRHYFRTRGIGPAQGITLHYICMNNGIDQIDLCAQLQLDKSSLTSQLKKLEEHGYIYREAEAEDRRAKKIFMTPKTVEIRDEVHAVFASWSSILLQGVDESERDTVFRFLDKMQENAEEALRGMRLNEEPE